MDGDSEKRKSGITLVGDIPWGSTLCHFYRTKKDSLDILVPYFKAGLENNELCLWIVSAPLSVKDAQLAMKKAVRGFDEFTSEGRMRILSENNKFSNAKTVDSAITAAVDEALLAGFEGLRMALNALPCNRGGKAFACPGAEAAGKDLAIAVYTYPPKIIPRLSSDGTRCPPSARGRVFFRRCSSTSPNVKRTGSDWRP